MSDSSYSQMMILLGFVFVLFLAMFGTIVFSVLKKRKKSSEAVVEKQTLQPPVPSLKTVPPTEPVPVVPEEKEITVAEALAKTEESFFGRIKKAFMNPDKKIVIDQIEEVLYTSDLGPQTVEKLLEAVKSELSGKEISDIGAVKLALQKEMREILEPVQSEFENNNHLQEQIVKAASGPTVLMIVGVNGAGKTTSIGKITAQLAKDGKKVLVAAGDTFRAAAGSQLKVE